jgi:hypothetical protein
MSGKAFFCNFVESISQWCNLNYEYRPEGILFLYPPEEDAKKLQRPRKPQYRGRKFSTNGGGSGRGSGATNRKRSYHYTVDTLDIGSNELKFLNAIVKKYALLIDLNAIINSSARTRLIIGKTQSSKSCLFWCLIWIQKRILKQQPIVICYNSKNSQDAMTNKEMKDFNMWAASFGVSPLQVIFDLDEMDDNSIPILLGNARQVGKVVQYMEDKLAQDSNHNFVINIDEADLIVQDNNNSLEDSTKQLQQKIKWLMDQDVPFSLITATPFAIWCSKIIENLQTFTLKPDISYRCLKNGKIKPFFVSKDFNMKNHEKLLELFYQTIKPHVESFLQNPLKYFAILYDSFHQKKDMLLFAKFVSKETQKNAYVVYRQSSNYCAQKVSNGEETSLCFPSIQALFNHLEEENSRDFVHLIAGQFASRANSWRPSREIGSGGLIAHVNSNCGHMETTLQKQRLTGNYDDTYPKQLQILEESFYHKILHEEENIEFGSTKTKEPCNPRENIKGNKMNVTGKHTRPAVDNTKNTDTGREEYHEFESEDAMNIFYQQNLHSELRQQPMNEILPEIRPDPPFPEDRLPTNGEVRAVILDKHPSLRGKHIHIATDNKRKKRLNDIRYRFTQQEYSVGEYTAEYSKDKKLIYLIKWYENFTKLHFVEKDGYDEHFPHNVYFKYYATNGKIRLYKNDGRRTAQISFLDSENL